MRHLTLNTGDLRESPEEEVDPLVADKLGWLIRRHAPHGEIADLPYYPGYRAQMTSNRGGLIVDISGAHPLVSIFVALAEADSDHLWPLLLRSSAIVGVKPGANAPPPPWCAVLLWPGLAADLSAAKWLGDAERCFAWAWVRINTPA